MLPRFNDYRLQKEDSLNQPTLDYNMHIKQKQSKPTLAMKKFL